TYADLPAGTELARASGFVTIQRGCDRFCAYCIVPLVRGRERAVPPETVLRQVGEQLAAGRREVTLLGQTVNSYRHGETDFPTLLRQVARQPGLARLRFLSPYPAGFGEELCALFASEPGLMPQVHLPLQSGSTAVLARMGRQYSREEYLALVHRLRTACPGIALSTDVLVGFPGESEEQLEQTVALLEQVRFQSAYLYRYSERPGTRAAHRFPDDVPEEEKLRRLQRVIDVQEGITREILDGWCGKEVEVLVDGPSRRDRQAASGRSRENIPVVVTAAGAVRPGELLAASVVRSTGHTLLAEPVRHG
ncbi:MAG: MiaB/RimO family radical SAM methylthiotransferase, partial [Deltaproteobacteria bacterium]|nr:MiaB/RimO family radical SAM methylthiotransferase [Deltaproteobacteria bacterium]